MRSKYFTLLTMALLLVGAKVLAQCPTLEKFNQGNGNPGSCAGVSGTPIPPSFIGTPYGVVPPGSKTAELNASWPTSPNPLPAVGGIYFNAMPTAHKAGPPTIPVLQGGKYKSQYCFYHPTGAAIPSFKTITIVYIDPIPDTVLRVCSYDPGGNEIPPPVITKQPEDQIGCLGYKSRFVVAAIKGEPTDTAVHYQWMKDGVDMPGKTDSILEIVVTAADTGTDRYQCRVIGMPSLGVALTVEVSLFLNKPHIWTGAISTNWNTAGNWIPATIPDSTKHVYVGPKLNKPFIPLADTGRCKCLTLDTGWVNLDGRLEVAGRIQLLDSTRYISALTTGHLVLNGTELPQDIPDGTFLQNRVFGLTVANALDVHNIDTLDIYGFINRILGVLTTADKITLKSVPTGTARVAQGPALGGYISGQVTVERYVPVVPGGYRAWRFLSVMTIGTQTIKQAWQENGSGIFDNPWPGYGTFITCSAASGFGPAQGYDLVMPKMSIQTFDEGAQSFTNTNVPNTNAKLLSSERAYFLYVRGDRTVLPAPVYDQGGSTTLRSKGLLRIGDQLPIAIPAGNFAALGNPFASPIDFLSLDAPEQLAVGNKFWLWDPRRSGSFGVGQWVLFSLTNAFLPQAAGGSYPNVPNTIIPLGMGFLLQGGLIGSNITVKEAAKFASNTNNGFKAPNNDRFQIALDYVKDATTVIPADGACAVFGNYTNDINADDAGKIAGAGENIAISHSGNDLTLDARPAITNDTVKLKMWNLVYTYDYRVTINPIVSTQGIKATFVDKYLQTTMPLDMTKPTVIDFKINKDTASFAINRFYIALSAAPVVTHIGDPSAAEVEIYPNPTDAQNINVNIKAADKGEYSFKIIDGQGRLVHAETYKHVGGSLNKSLSVQGRLVPSNYFVVVSKDGHELSTKKLIINK
ncbi:T9SS type A sorting domain-containing protein [Polluticoccus soli]|uniref:T9SS type A sorting domain-containing protein n=1 Tax=Polluticoccus soli TaxID=3034150 RepID=UPI0023E27F9A|nr:T9SS type A sorting domain-containing protein [Flavipsychrobacter sp. JY13-12]